MALQSELGISTSILAVSMAAGIPLESAAGGLSATSTITFTQSNAVGQTYNLTASNALALTQSALVVVPLELSALDSLVLAQQGQSNMLTRTASNGVAFAQRADIGQELSLTAANFFAPTQGARPGLLTRTAYNSFQPVQLAIAVNQLLTAIPLTASDTLTLTQTNNRVHALASGTALTASDTLVLIQRAIFPIELDTSDGIFFTQSADGVPGKSGTQTFDLEQSVILNQVRSLTASDVIEFRHSFVYTLLRDGIIQSQSSDCKAENSYSPAQGGDGRPPIRELPPSLDRFNDVLFYFPLIGGTCNPDTTLTLRTPNFGDRDRNQYNRIKRESRGGSLRVFRDPKWPQQRTLVLDFSGLKDDEIGKLILFLTVSIGQKVGLRDWRGEIWFGVIINPNTPVVRTGTNRNDVTIEMEVDDRGLSLDACNLFELSQSNAVEVP